MFVRFCSSCHNVRRGRISHSARDKIEHYADGVLVFVAVVVVAVVLIMIVGRNNTSGAEPTLSVVGIDADGLHLPGDPTFVVPWDDVWEITVMTRRAVRGTWFGFEVRADGHGLLSIDGQGGLGERFLAEVYRFPGFDHRGLGEALGTRQPRLVCFTR